MAEISSDQAQTASERALTQLRRDIVNGVLEPGTKLKMRELVARYDTGATPLREALSQLVSRDLVVSENNRGFRVAPVSEAILQDITFTREHNETEALRLAMQHGTVDWEDRVASSLNLLERELARKVEESQDWLNRYEERHHEFHRALISACPYSTLKQICDELYTQMTRYRRLLRARSMYPITPEGDHTELMDLTLSRDPKAIDALRAHVGRTRTFMHDYLTPEDDRLANLG